MSDAPFSYWLGANPEYAQATSAASPSMGADYADLGPTGVRALLADGSIFARGAAYALARRDPRGDYGPEHLAIFEMDSEAAANRCIARAEAQRDAASAWWRLVWRRLGSTIGSPSPDTSHRFLVAMNVPASTSEAELAEFNAFYTDIHLPEILAELGLRSATRYELHRAFDHPSPGAPRFLAVYETDEAAIQTFGKGGPPKLSPGPKIWQSRDTLWRLVYRRV